MCGMKLPIHSKTSTVQQLKFGNESVISSHTLLGMWLLIHVKSMLIKMATGDITATKQTTTKLFHYNDVTMGSMASQITSLTVVYASVYSGADQRKHQISASLAFVRVIHRSPVNSPHKWPGARKMFPSDDVIMSWDRLFIVLCVDCSHIFSRQPTGWMHL